VAPVLGDERSDLSRYAESLLCPHPKVSDRVAITLATRGMVGIPAELDLFFIRIRSSCRGDADTVWTNEIPVGKPLIHKEDRSIMRVRVLLAVSAATLTGLTTMVGSTTANAAPSQTGQLH